MTQGIAVFDSQNRQILSLTERLSSIVQTGTVTVPARINSTTPGSTFTSVPGMLQNEGWFVMSVLNTWQSLNSVTYSALRPLVQAGGFLTQNYDTKAYIIRYIVYRR